MAQHIVLAQQLLRLAGQLWPQGQRLAEVLCGERVFFRADEVQPGRGRGMLQEVLPGTEKVESGAKAGFADAELAIGRQGGKTLGQLIVPEENMAGFFQPAVTGEIDIAKGDRDGLAIQPIELCV